MRALEAFFTVLVLTRPCIIRAKCNEVVSSGSSRLFGVDKTGSRVEGNVCSEDLYSIQDWLHSHLPNAINELLGLVQFAAHFSVEMISSPSRFVGMHLNVHSCIHLALISTTRPDCRRLSFVLPRHHDGCFPAIFSPSNSSCVAVHLVHIVARALHLRFLC